MRSSPTLHLCRGARLTMMTEMGPLCRADFQPEGPAVLCAATQGCALYHVEDPRLCSTLQSCGVNLHHVASLMLCDPRLKRLRQ